MCTGVCVGVVFVWVWGEVKWVCDEVGRYICYKVSGEVMRWYQVRVCHGKVGLWCGSVVRWVCGVVKWVCGVVRWVCGVVRWVCSLARWACGMGKWVCGMGSGYVV